MTDTTLDQATWLDDEEAPDGQLPPRPRRKLATPATAGLAAVIIAAAGFVGGVEAQKSSATATTPTGGGAGARTAGFAGGPPGAAGRPANGAAGALTTGEVKNKDGSTLYVTDADGNTIKVKTTSNSKVSRNATADAGEIQPGDTVVIQGTTDGRRHRRREQRQRDRERRDRRRRRLPRWPGVRRRLDARLRWSQAMTPRSVRAGAAVLGSAALLAVAGCGGGGSAAPSTSATQGTQPAARAGGPMSEANVSALAKDLGVTTARLQEALAAARPAGAPNGRAQGGQRGSGATTGRRGWTRRATGGRPGRAAEPAHRQGPAGAGEGHATPSAGLGTAEPERHPEPELTERRAPAPAPFNGLYFPTEGVSSHERPRSTRPRPCLAHQPAADPRDGRSPRSTTAGAVCSVVLVAAITVILEPLSDLDPGISSGVLYVLAVLFIAMHWGLWLGVATGVLSGFALALQSRRARALVPRGRQPATWSASSSSCSPASSRPSSPTGRAGAPSMPKSDCGWRPRLRRREADRAREQEVRASRARVLDAADAERRRIVRDLHDGTQQRLVQAVVLLKLARQALERGDPNGAELVGEALEQAEAADAELSDLARGILPRVLTLSGLTAGLGALASRFPLPVEVDVSVGRLPASVEATAYFVVAEASTNVAKQACAQQAWVAAHLDGDVLRVAVGDDGRRHRPGRDRPAAARRSPGRDRR